MKNSFMPGRIAFMLNMNAKSVTQNFIKIILDIVPKKDLYLSKNFDDAKKHCQKILNDGYAYMFCGGGDGTVVHTINLIMSLAKKNPSLKIPKIGVLKLGTGNALARMLYAKDPILDVKSLILGKKLDFHLINMIETENGMLTPFAGLGYDGEMMSDFSSLKDTLFKSPFRKIFLSVLGFAAVGIFKTLPRQFIRKPIFIKIKTNHEAYQIINNNNKDEEVFLPKDQILFAGNAALISVGTIRSVGYNFMMFPFANRRPGYMHLRICAVPLHICLANISKAWMGTFRHPRLYDFLVKDVQIESDQGLAYQFAGDSMGKKHKLYFKISPDLVPMVSIRQEKRRPKYPPTPLMTSLR